MKYIPLLICIIVRLHSGYCAVNEPKFNITKDLLLIQYDCKTDVDDLHSVAAFNTLISNPEFSKIQYHAVAGTYGIQEGLYVPPNELFSLTFGDNWSDAHSDRKAAVVKVMKLVKSTLENKGDVWIAEAGQSDFTALIIKAVQSEIPGINTLERIHVVQHSNWNEEVASPENLQFVKNNSDYHKIPDGNVVGNGSPGFRNATKTELNKLVTNPAQKEIWRLASQLANLYNGKDGRYLNEAISAGGVDFSDTSEVCWILGIQDIKDSDHFFAEYAK